MISEKIFLAGIALIVIGILFLVISSIIMALQGREGKIKTEAGVGGFVGPIPFGFFTSRKAFWLWLLLLAIMAAIYFLIRRLS